MTCAIDWETTIARDLGAAADAQRAYLDWLHESGQCRGDETCPGCCRQVELAALDAAEAEEAAHGYPEEESDPREWSALLPRPWRAGGEP